MKFILKITLLSLLVVGCKSYTNLPLAEKTTEQKTENKVVIDAYDTANDKILVSIYPTKQQRNEVGFFLPKIIPGTYSIDNYGQFIENLKALDPLGNELKTIKKDSSHWQISNAQKLYKIEYTVNDSFDIENEHDVFSPAGTNIEHHRNYVLNLHGFVGYLENQANQPFDVKIKHHKNLNLGCSQPISSSKKALNITEDSFYFDRYATLIDTPIFLSWYELEQFQINDIKVTLGVHSANNKLKAKDLVPSMQKMMIAQKHFMGNINNTNTYSIFLYLSNQKANSPKGFGALEHNNSTIVVLPEALPFDKIEQHLIDIVSHEFFHIITPLSIHSKEIHDFNYTQPNMSKHLWMYEGITEYFAQLFQVKEGIISTEEFYDRMSTKINRSMKFQDDLSFTLMSKNVLEEPYKKNYPNVYEKGALIAMCIDILIKEDTNGEKTILDMMQSLSKTYGKDRPFDDDALFDIVKSITNQKVYDFLKEHVEEGKPIDYNIYLNKIGANLQKSTSSIDYFNNGDLFYISPNETSNEIYFNKLALESSFLRKLGIQENDVLVSVNNKKFDLNNARYLLDLSQNWGKGTHVSITIKREGKIITKDTVIETSPSVTSPKIILNDNAESTVKYL